MPQVQHVFTNTPTSEIIDILERDGCIVIENVLSGAALAELQSELQPHFQKTSLCHGNFYGHKTKRLSGLVTKSSQCRSMAIHPTILAVMDAFLLKGSREYQLNLTQAISIGPGEPEQIIHPDDPMFPFEHPGYEAMINCMWAVDDFKIENGATQVIPGSHKWPKDRRPKPEEILQGTMPAGSVLIYFGSLLHGGGANRSDAFRTGVVISYSLGWLKQAENSFLVAPPEVAKAYNERLQRLLGYFVHKPNLGCVEGQDPILLLQEKSIESIGFEEFLPEEVQPLLEEHLQKVSQAA